MTRAQFTLESAKRIADATRRVETSPVYRDADKHRGPGAIVQEPSLWELTGNLTRTSDEDEWYATATRMLWNSTHSRWKRDSTQAEQYLYLSTQILRDGNNKACGLIKYRSGQRVWAVHRRKWMIVGDPADRARIEVTAALTAGGSCTAHIIGWDNDAGIYTDDLPGEGALDITVHDPLAIHSKIATQSGDRGAIGRADFMADSNRWEIVNLANPGPFWGELDANLTQSAASVSVTKLDILSEYDIFGTNWNAANGGLKITAYNPAGNVASYWWQGHAGDRCFCYWDIEGAKYWILVVEPNNYQYQSLQVSVPGGTRTIELPPWTTIANP